MKTNPHCIDRNGDEHVIATFGDAQLVRHINGRYELCSGSASDHTDAKQWISLFLHEAAVSYPSPIARRSRSSGLARCVSNASVHWVGFLRSSYGSWHSPPRGLLESHDNTRSFFAPKHISRKAKERPVQILAGRFDLQKVEKCHQKRGRFHRREDQL
jgi:hypothetical protein